MTPLTFQLFADENPEPTPWTPSIASDVDTYFTLRKRHKPLLLEGLPGAKAESVSKQLFRTTCLLPVHRTLSNFDPFGAWDTYM